MEYSPIPYPKWIYSEVLGKDIIVQNHVEHSVHVGQEFGPDGNLIDAPLPGPDEETDGPDGPLSMISTADPEGPDFEDNNGGREDVQ